MSSASGAVAPRGASAGRGVATLSAAILAALVVATFLAIFYAQELKRRPPLVVGWTTSLVRFRPGGPGHREAHFHLRTSVSGRLAISIVSAPGGRVVDVIAARAHAWDRVVLTWSGRTSGGAQAPSGRYTVRVRFARGGQSVPVAIAMELEAPS